MASRRFLRGWIAVEVILSLALLALVLEITQRQMVQQWQSIQQSQADRARQQNHNKQEAMVALTGDDRWRELDDALPSTQYPACQKCSGDAFFAWFRATQHSVSASIMIDDAAQDHQP